MAKEGQLGLEAITGALGRAANSANRPAAGRPPVELWNPPFCGDLDMRIAADGTWFYLKTPIGRPALAFGEHGKGVLAFIESNDVGFEVVVVRAACATGA